MAIKFLNSVAVDTDVLFVDTANERVGIGTASPTQKLHVDGNTIISAEKYYYTAGTGAGFGSDASGNFKIRQNGADLIFGSGNSVGIGTTSPNRLLHLLTTTTDETQQLLIQNGHSGDAAIMFNISGDTYSLGIDNSDGDKFKLSYGNLGVNDRIVIDSTGNVGIGTTGPSAKLEVAADTTTNVDIVHFSNSNDIAKAKISLSANGSGELSLIDGSNNTDVFITSNGNSYFNGGAVGIGTTSPNAPLSVHNTTSTLGSRVASFYHSNGTNNPFIEINSLSDGMQLKAGFTTGVAGHFDILTGGGSSFITLSPGSSEKMRITSAGNVGIGTTSPSQKLQVAGNIYTTGSVRIENAGNQLEFGNANVAMQRTSNLLELGGYDGIVFKSSNAVLDSQAERMRITSAGNVGIGTTSPSEKLHVAGGGSGNIRLDAGGTYYGTNIQAISSTGLKIGNDDFSGYAFFHNDGNVGIGTTSPAYKLDVNGSARVNGLLTIPGAIGHDGDVGTSIGFSGNDTIALSTNGSTKLEINALGQTAITGTLRVGTDLFNSLSITSGLTGTTYTTVANGLNSQPDISFKTGVSTRLKINGVNGEVGIGVTTPRAKLDVAGGVKVADDTDTAGANKVGTLRYRYVPGSPKNFSYVDMCMQTGASSYAWVNIVQNAWN